MVRQEDAVLVLFRMREVVLRSSLSGKMRRMQPLSTCASVSFCTRCMERLTVKVPMPLAASKSMSSGVRPATSPFPQCAHQREVHRQMQDGILHAVQCRSHLLYRPDGALLCGLLGTVHGNRAFDKDAPFHGILERSTQ